MEKLTVNVPGKSYEIYISSNFNFLVEAIRETGINLNSKIVIITDRNVDRYYSEECSRILGGAGLSVFKIIIEPGEKSKNLETAASIYSYLVSNFIGRDDSILALGGGVVGDISGFVAATYLRGINFIQVPTTLLSQADSSVGGKVGVDFSDYKNLIGAFYQPALVYVNTDCLKTLPKREVRAGMAEVIVHAIIMDKDFFHYIESNTDKIFELESKTLEYLIKVNCAIKGNIVEQDEKDKGIRAILNFGHTVGHAVETAAGFRLLHGECVSLGIIAAFYLAAYLGITTEAIQKEVTDLLKRAGLPIKVSNISIDDIYSCILHDKKCKDNRAVFILPVDIGKVFMRQIDDEGLIRKAISQIIE
ncbi:MAG TPA: 3-dehydroquinate synthase [Ruminiclostridium sp.]|nr:3-dehydroquinate synthase [Ruminiclostridium sp.]